MANKYSHPQAGSIQAIVDAVNCKDYHLAGEFLISTSLITKDRIDFESLCRFFLRKHSSDLANNRGHTDPYYY